ncbi:MAG: alpha/beta hydrolase [Chloroflexota bacterium]
MEVVRFTTYDNVDLVANLYLPRGGSGDWTSGIIVCHGFGSCKENYAHFGEMAAEEGFAALILDLRGHGESGGEVDANIFNDVAAALHYLQTRPEVNPMSIAVQGSSMGGWLALHTAAHLRDISPVVAYCPSNESTLTILMEEVAMVQRGHSSPLVPTKAPRVNVNSMTQLLYRLDLIKVARRIEPRPLLIVQCENDQVVPPHLSQRLYDAVKEPKALWLLPRGSHNFAQHDPDTNRRVLEWLAESRPHTEKLVISELPDD